MANNEHSRTNRNQSHIRSYTIYLNNKSTIYTTTYCTMVGVYIALWSYVYPVEKQKVGAMSIKQETMDGRKQKHDALVRAEFENGGTEMGIYVKHIKITTTKT